MQVDSQYVKGAYFECCVQSKELKDGENHKRVYTITQAQQCRNGILGPHMEAKVYDDEEEQDDVKICQKLADICLSYLL